MSDLDSILDGLADALELERELGTRAVDCDRALLAPPGGTTSPRQQAPVDAAPSPRREEVERQVTRDKTEASPSTSTSTSPSPSTSTPASTSTSPSTSTPTSTSTPASTSTPTSTSSLLPLVFLHDRALSSRGVEMMAKIVAAMHLTPETAPVLFTGTRPAARATVVLGHGALRKWFPGVTGAPGQWISPDGTPNVLVTYSPEYILRFGTVTPAVQKLKREMWTSLKAVLQRIGA